MLAIVIAISALVFTIRPKPTPIVDSVAYLNAIHTDAVHVFGEEPFRGCPHFMHQVQEPNGGIFVETLWTSTLEEMRKAIDPNAYDRGNHIAINWHGNFEKQIN